MTLPVYHASAGRAHSRYARAPPPVSTPPTPPSNRASAVRDAAALATGWTLLALRWPSLVAGRALPSSQDGFGVSDLFDVTLPLQQWIAAARASSRDGAWFPLAFGGLPTASIPEAIPHYPVTALLFALERPEAALAHAIWLHLALALGGAFLFARSLGASRGAALLAGLGAGAGLWLPNHFRQFNLLATAAWLPLVWWAVERALQAPSRRAAARLALAAGAMALAGHGQMLHHGALATAALAIARAPSVPRAQRAAAARSLLAGATIAALIGAATLAPVAEAVSLADLARRRAALDGAGAGHLWNLLSLLHPALTGDADAPVAGVFSWEETAYVGLGAIPLCALAAWRARRRPLPPTARALAITLALSVALAYLSAVPVLREALRVVPGMASTRFHTRFLWPASIALAALAALALDALAAELDPRRQRALSIALAALLSLDLAAASWRRCPVAPPGATRAEPETARVIRARHGAGAHREGRVFTLIDPARREALLAAPFIEGGDAALARGRAQMAGEGPARWGWSTLRGYVGITPAWSAATVGDQHRAGRLHVLAAGCESPGAPGCPALVAALEDLGTRWVVASRALLDGLATRVGTTPGDAPWTVYRLARTRPAPTLEDDRGATIPARGRASLGAARFSLDADAPDAGWLVRDQAFHPRWRCLVDGAPATTAPRVGMLLGVRVPAPGHHRVSCAFDASLERRARWASLAGLALAIALALPRRRLSAAAP